MSLIADRTCDSSRSPPLPRKSIPNNRLAPTRTDIDGIGQNDFLDLVLFTGYAVFVAVKFKGVAGVCIKYPLRLCLGGKILAITIRTGASWKISCLSRRWHWFGRFLHRCWRWYWFGGFLHRYWRWHWFDDLLHRGWRWQPLSTEECDRFLQTTPRHQRTAERLLGSHYAGEGQGFCRSLDDPTVTAEIRAVI